jgi:hypothetical protein
MEEVNKQEPEIIIKETKIFSFGEQLTGIDFSTEEEGSVYHVKKTMADLTNLLLDEYQKGDKSPIKSLLFDSNGNINYQYIFKRGEYNAIDADIAFSKLANTF